MPVDNFIDDEIPVCTVMAVLSNDQHFTYFLEVFDDAFDLSGADTGYVGDALNARPGSILPTLMVGDDNKNEFVCAGHVGIVDRGSSYLEAHCSPNGMTPRL
jgi:L-fucose isomerase-like protein